MVAQLLTIFLNNNNFQNENKVLKYQTVENPNSYILIKEMQQLLTTEMTEILSKKNQI